VVGLLNTRPVEQPTPVISQTTVANIQSPTPIRWRGARQHARPDASGAEVLKHQLPHSLTFRAMSGNDVWSGRASGGVRRP
jgi:hypothetical protein